LIYKLLTTFLLLLASTLIFAQSPWVENKGSFYAALTGTSITYTDIFNSEGEGAQNAFETSDGTISFYGNYSLTDRTAIVVDLPFKVVSIDSSSLSALGDLKFQVKHELLKGFPLTAFASYAAPTATREGALRTGFRQHAVDGGLSTGFSRGSAFGYFGGGYRYRSEIPNQIVIDTEIGTKIELGSRALYLIFHIDGALNLDDAEDPEADGSVLYHNNGSFLSPGIKAGLNIADNWWINFGTYGAITATNQGAAPSLSLGVAYKYSKE